jgi:hypothetical protein
MSDRLLMNMSTFAPGATDMERSFNASLLLFCFQITRPRKG